tara:strand:+ start:1200 stop:2093 length:894 start_codon:yes stop_codon:yes gene_type:complete
MAEETGSAPAGNPADAPAPSGETSADVTAVPGSALQTEPAPSWLDGVQDPSTKAWAEAKGLQNGSFENVLGSYHNLEKMVGADRAGRTIVQLGDDATTEERDAYYEKLGRPKEAAQYSVALPEGVTDDTRLNMMRNKAYELGISDAQFSGLAEADAAYIAATAGAQEEFAVTSAADAEAQLRKDWGASFDLKVAGIDVAAHKLGFNDDQLNALRVAMGPVEAMKFVDGLNTKMGDHSYEDGETIIPGHKTPAQAKEELDGLSMNKEFMDAWMNKQHPGHKAAVEKKSSLARLVSGIV